MHMLTLLSKRRIFLLPKKKKGSHLSPKETDLVSVKLSKERAELWTANLNYFQGWTANTALTVAMKVKCQVIPDFRVILIRAAVALSEKL